MPINDDSLRGPTTETYRRPNPQIPELSAAFPLSCTQLPLLALIGAVPHARGSRTGLLVDYRLFTLSSDILTRVLASHDECPSIKHDRPCLVLNSMALASAVAVPFLSS